MMANVTTAHTGMCQWRPTHCRRCMRGRTRTNSPMIPHEPPITHTGTVAPDGGARERMISEGRHRSNGTIGISHCFSCLVRWLKDVDAKGTWAMLGEGALDTPAVIEVVAVVTQPDRPQGRNLWHQPARPLVTPQT